MNLEQRIEAVLFYKAKPVSLSFLQKFLEVPEEELGNAISTLQSQLSSRGLRLIVASNKEIQLVTAPELSELIEALRKDDLKRDIGSAGAETLAVILYRGPIARSAIDRIRGVNSSYILRNLQVRGLVERIGSDAGSGYSYQVTPQLLAHLGITHKEQLADYADIANALDAFEAEPEPT